MNESDAVFLEAANAGSRPDLWLPRKAVAFPVASVPGVGTKARVRVRPKVRGLARVRSEAVLRPVRSSRALAGARRHVQSTAALEPYRPRWGDGEDGKEAVESKTTEKPLPTKTRATKAKTATKKKKKKKKSKAVRGSTAGARPASGKRVDRALSASSVAASAARAHHVLPPRGRVAPGEFQSLALQYVTMFRELHERQTAGGVEPPPVPNAERAAVVFSLFEQFIDRLDIGDRHRAIAESLRDEVIAAAFTRDSKTGELKPFFELTRELRREITTLHEVLQDLRSEVRAQQDVIVEKEKEVEDWREECGHKSDLLIEQRSMITRLKTQLQI